MRPALKTLLVLGVAVLGVAPAAAEELWAVRSGQAVIHLNVGLLHDLGIEVTVDAPAAEHDDDVMVEEPHWAFAIRKNSSFRFRTEHGAVLGRGVVGGALRLEGALTLRDRASGKQVRVDDLEIARVQDPGTAPAGARGSEPLHLRSSSTRLVLFELVSSMFDFRAGERALRVHYLNLKIAASWARAMGRPELTGWVVGVAEVRGGASAVSATAPRSPVRAPVLEGALKDVSLGDLDFIQQVAHEGTPPTGTAALSMSTTSCNVGTVDVPWLAPMQEDHPLIHMALYRLLDARFEQIGVSWLKHGFFALSDNQCTPCPSPSNGTYLAVGCSDTYDVSNNSTRSYLGPRSEVNPYTGTWECTGSHFSGGVADCIRRHTSTGHGPLDHRLVVADADLDNPGATYYYEAYYVIRGDEKLDNNWGSRRCTMTWNGVAWVFDTPAVANPLVEGPALGRWGELSTTVNAALDDGQVLLAVQTSDLGGGLYHYEYALLNRTSDRQIRSFSLPVSGVANLTNLGFHDNDSDSSNDWQVAVEGGQIKWQTGTFGGSPPVHPLEFGFMFNFRFDADASPVAASASLGLFKPGTGTEVTAGTLGPQNAPTAVGETRAPIARLLSVRPNPFSQTATIAFELTAPGGVKLTIHDAAGRLVRSLVDEGRGPGAHVATWDGMVDGGERARAGVYHARLQAGGETAVRALIVTR